MASYKISRRQFLKWVSASAAVLGLSQTDILKLEESLAAAMTACTPDFPNSLNPAPLNKTYGRVLWLTGADCGGCPTSLLNYLADPNDPDVVLKALATNGGSLGLPPLVPIADIETLTPQGGDGNLDIAEVVIEVVTIDWHYIVMAASGDPANQHMATLRGSDPFVLAIDGAILTGGTDQHGTKGAYCSVFSIPGDWSGGIWDDYIYVYPDPTGVAVSRTDFTMAGATLWLASSPNCLAVVADGTCASFGGVPAASAALPAGGRGNITGALSAWEWLNQVNHLNKIIVNIPGCPPNSDWQIASIAAALLELKSILDPTNFGMFSGILLNNLDTSADHKGRPKLTYTPVYHSDASYAFCLDCPRNPTRPGPSDDLCKAARTKANELTGGLCMDNRGCNGWMAGPAHIRPDCPTRKWNKFEDMSKNNWCVGNNMPCQGCASPGFPDYTSPFYKKAKYRY
jgi:hydrogenase small subunit